MNEVSELEVLNAHRAPGQAKDGLLELIRDCIKPGMMMAEIGCYAGASTRLFHQAIGNGEIYAVDTWEGVGVPRFDEVAEHWFNTWCLDTINVQKLKGRSVEIAKDMPDGVLDFVYIDADHRYEAVLADVKAWRGKLNPMGRMAGHDASLPGVCQALNEVAICWRLYPDDSWVITEWK